MNTNDCEQAQGMYQWANRVVLKGNPASRFLYEGVKSLMIKEQAMHVIKKDRVLDANF